MEQQHESDLVKRLEQLGIEVDVSPTGTSLTYEQIYTSGPTLEEALMTPTHMSVDTYCKYPLR
jgi:hypothetical protein